ncbi:MAG: FUSC family protein [Bdellovibrionia bacterium]
MKRKMKVLTRIKPLKPHLLEILKKESNPVPLTRMILCAVGSTLPLVIGAINGHLPISIYGALTGYFLALNDHLGTLGHRLWVVTLTFLFVLLGFCTGFLLHDQQVIFQICIVGLVYWLGILGGDGAELERATLFLVVGLIAAFFSKTISLAMIPLFCLYSFIGYFSVMAAMLILKVFLKREPEPFLGLRASFQKSLTKEREKHIHAASYTLMTLSSIWFAQYFHVERGYWIAITVLLVMRADPTLSLYKTSQRLFGTGLGVLFCEIVQIISDPWVLILGVMACTMTLPWALKKNYLYASFLVTIFIVLLLELAMATHGDTSNSFVRLRATLIGCIFSVIGTAFSKLISRKGSSQAV